MVAGGVTVLELTLSSLPSDLPVADGTSLQTDSISGVWLWAAGAGLTISTAGGGGGGARAKIMPATDASVCDVWLAGLAAGFAGFDATVSLFELFVDAGAACFSPGAEVAAFAARNGCNFSVIQAGIDDCFKFGAAGFGATAVGSSSLSVLAVTVVFSASAERIPALPDYAGAAFGALPPLWAAAGSFAASSATDGAAALAFSCSSVLICERTLEKL
jgi:hypothetical protein